MKQPIHFDEVIERIVERDPRYHRDAYAFLRDALDFTQSIVSRGATQKPRRRRGTKQLVTEEPKHVTGEELMNGVRDFALDQFGPMAMTVFEEWGVTTTRDFGEIVFNMIGENLLSKTEDDRPQDFDNVYVFEDVFRTPFLPRSKLRSSARQSNSPDSN